MLEIKHPKRGKRDAKLLEERFTKRSFFLSKFSNEKIILL